jgi:hypothetical protein
MAARRWTPPPPPPLDNDLAHIGTLSLQPTSVATPTVAGAASSIIVASSQSVEGISCEQCEYLDRRLFLHYLHYWPCDKHHMSCIYRCFRACWSCYYECWEYYPLPSTTINTPMVVANNNNTPPLPQQQRQPEQKRRIYDPGYAHPSVSTSTSKKMHETLAQNTTRWRALMVFMVGLGLVAFALYMLGATSFIPLVVVVGVMLISLGMYIRGGYLLHLCHQHKLRSKHLDTHQFHVNDNSYLTFLIGLQEPVSNSSLSTFVNDPLYDHNNMIRLITSFVDPKIQSSLQYQQHQTKQSSHHHIVYPSSPTSQIAFTIGSGVMREAHEISIHL